MTEICLSSSSPGLFSKFFKLRLPSHEAPGLACHGPGPATIDVGPGEGLGFPGPSESRIIFGVHSGPFALSSLGPGGVCLPSGPSGPISYPGQPVLGSGQFVGPNGGMGQPGMNESGPLWGFIWWNTSQVRVDPDDWYLGRFHLGFLSPLRERGWRRSRTDGRPGGTPPWLGAGDQPGKQDSSDVSLSQANSRVSSRASARLVSSPKISVMERAKRRKARILEGDCSSSGSLASRWSSSTVRAKSAHCGVKLTVAEAEELHKFMLRG
uniref:Uncharacterized protein n=1 Tax=Ananas comosus var. bracteatus TaxID=296719 RepID=A0A6V7QE11_ANACO|nr:unnamed protein product [Ananas comosus var. bracteatus]